ncbi:unnamed protein product [Ranitomeya imitator]|uniref:Phosphatidylinositol-specific phospholipase C X domain-containing protein n=1 Tax=Ranitomeya imitator TaxID=111125 RepID=A0ABN9KW20_9NEOB|nr:unnamed protein product [Ranitomeya imitator]
MDPVKVQAIHDWTQPTSLKSLQKFLGFANFYRRFICNFSSIAKPLTDLTKKGADLVNWSSAAVEAFQDLKRRFSSAPVLCQPDVSLPFQVEVDASEIGAGAVLSQRGQVESSDCPGVDTVVDRLQQIWTHVVDNLTLSQEKAQRFANRRRRVGPRLRVGDLVWLSSRHIPMKVSSPKFKPCFIGSHDSFSFYIDESSPVGPEQPETVQNFVSVFGTVAKKLMRKWLATQTMNFTSQMEAGVRYFDLRISTKPRDPDNELYFAHGLFSAKVNEGLQEINAFLSSHKKEVVFLDFNHFYGMQKSHHEMLVQMLKDIFGNKTCPAIFAQEISLQYLWERNYQILVFYHSPVALEVPFLWPGQMMPAPWANTTDTEKLIQFLQSSITERRKKGSFFISQVVLTPKASTVVKGVTSGLRETITERLTLSYMLPLHPPYRIFQWVNSGPIGRMRRAQYRRRCHNGCHGNDDVIKVASTNQRRAQSAARILESSLSIYYGDMYILEYPMRYSRCQASTNQQRAQYGDNDVIKVAPTNQQRAQSAANSGIIIVHILRGHACSRIPDALESGHNLVVIISPYVTPHSNNIPLCDPS